jgi:putative cardiolipin synthase
MHRKMRYMTLLFLSAALLIASCAGQSQKRSHLLDSEFNSEEFITRIYDYRTWYPPAELPFNPIGLGKQVDIPVNDARTKIIGPTYEDALDSLAAKIWMIENATHSVDLVYYIFKRDTAGYAILGALCNAVKRGVDVRIMVDSVGSFDANHNELRALETCTAEAGFVKDEMGRATDKKARVQVVLINALSKWSSRKNRRAHDKLIITDGLVPDQAIVMTGGRNVSVSYYGIHDDGTPDPTAYQDLEIILRTNPLNPNEQISVGDVATGYYTMLFWHDGNKRLRPVTGGGNAHKISDRNNLESYRREKEKAQEKLLFVKSLSGIERSLVKMPTFMTTGFNSSWVRLAHELGNLTSKNAVTGVKENLEKNPNSISTIGHQTQSRMKEVKTVRIVSPYFFIPRYVDKNGVEIFDGVKQTYKWLEENPHVTIELVTNSVLTSDNFIAQAVIDMDTAPRMLLSPDMLERWLSGLKKGEYNPELVESDEWKKLISHPRIKIYQTGKNDSVILGGNKHYGKLHAKFVVFDEFGFVGTTNFDYRSRLFNNEMGFYFKDKNLANDLIQVFESLKAKSYPWGTKEWLQMRKTLMSQDGMKASTTRKQRGLFKTARSTGIHWLF